MLYPVASMDFVKLQKSLAYTQGNLSSHLAKLQAAGFLALEKEFKGKYPVTVCSLAEKRARSIRRLWRRAENRDGGDRPFAAK